MKNFVKPIGIFSHGIPIVSLLALFLSLFGTVNLPAATEEIDLQRAVLVIPGQQSAAEKSAVSMLVVEIEKRTRLRLPVRKVWPADDVPVIALGTRSKADAWAGRHSQLLSAVHGVLPPEGFTLQTVSEEGKSPAVLIAGSDPRGVLFGCGRLLRELWMTPGALKLASPLDITTSPRYPIRGHQLGYRPKTNSYDGWTEELWRQYIRDLAVFGTNSVELIPPRSDDDADSPHFPLPPMEMMIRMSRILDEHDMDVWIWYPAMEADYSRPETVRAELQAWGNLFARVPRIDAIFVPGGDPGHTAPKVLMAFLEKVTTELRRHHPRAQMWMSPQSFRQEWLKEFLEFMKERQPAWLSGIVYGPQTRISLPELRSEIPRQYPIRRYPDITHSLNCQYPVPEWDPAYALTEAREGVNPRPEDQAVIFHRYQEYATGFITYSEGCNDDVNKFVWSGLGWNPDASPREILRQYSRYFIGPEYQESFTDGLFALESNWRGPLAKNEAVTDTLQLFQRLERQVSPSLLLNWRFQQTLYRAYYDAYVRKRLLRETELETKVLEILKGASVQGALAGIDRAESLLGAVDALPADIDLRTRIYQLAEALFQSIRMQLSVPLYRAIDVGRGANLDTLDVPLHNRDWLRERFREIRSLPEERQRLDALQKIVDWENPGPGGYYDQLGNPERRPHLVPGLPYREDPAFFRTAITAFAYKPGWRTSWCRHADALFDLPLQMRYTGLDPQANYLLRVVYAGSLAYPVRLQADERWEIHPLQPKPNPVRPLEFEIPVEATRDGDLLLNWTSTSGRGGNGRGPQVAEVWLMKK